MSTKIKAMTASEFGQRANLPHKEVLRRIRKNQIKAQKLGWVWVITEEDAQEALNSDWYQQYKNKD